VQNKYHVRQQSSFKNKIKEFLESVNYRLHYHLWLLNINPLVIIGKKTTIQIYKKKRYERTGLAISPGLLAFFRLPVCVMSLFGRLRHRCGTSSAVRMEERRIAFHASSFAGMHDMNLEEFL